MSGDLGLNREDGTGLGTSTAAAVGFWVGRDPRLANCPFVEANGGTAGIMLVRRPGRPPPDRVGSPWTGMLGTAGLIPPGFGVDTEPPPLLGGASRLDSWANRSGIPVDWEPAPFENGPCGLEITGVSGTTGVGRLGWGVRRLEIWLRRFGVSVVCEATASESRLRRSAIELLGTLAVGKEIVRVGVVHVEMAKDPVPGGIGILGGTPELLFVLAPPGVAEAPADRVKLAPETEIPGSWLGGARLLGVMLGPGEDTDGREPEDGTFRGADGEEPCESETGGTDSDGRDGRSSESEGNERLRLGTEGSCADGNDSDGTDSVGDCAGGSEPAGTDNVENDPPGTVTEAGETDGRESEGNPRLGSGRLLVVPPGNGTEPPTEGVGRPVERPGRESGGSPVIGSATGTDHDCTGKVAVALGPRSSDKLSVGGDALTSSDAGPEAKPDKHCES